MKVQILFWGYLLFLSIGSFAQNKDERALADSLFIKEGRFGEAGEIYEELARQWQQQGNLDSAFRHHLLYAKTLMQAQKYSACLQMCAQLLSDPWKQHATMYLGQVYAIKGYVELEQYQLEDAIESLSKAVAIEAEGPKPDTLKMADSQQFLGLAFMYSDRNVEAEKQLLESYERFQQHLPKDDINLAYIANSLYLFYDEMYQFDRAGNFLKEAVRILQLHLPPSHPHIATLLQNLAILYNATGKPRQAREIFMQLIELNEEAGRDMMLLESYINLVYLLIELGEFDQVEGYLQKSLVMGDSLLPDPGFERANLYDMLGSHAYQTREHARADSFFHLGLRQKEEMGVRMQKEIARSYHNLGLVAIERQEWTGASRLFGKSIQIRQRELGEDHPLTLESQYRLGTTILKLGKRQEALSIWKRCLMTFWRRQGLAYHHVGDMAIWLARAYHDLGEVDSSDRYLRILWANITNREMPLTHWDETEEAPIQAIRPEVFEMILFHLTYLLDHPELPDPEKLLRSQKVLQQFNEFLPRILPLLQSRQAQSSLAKTIRQIYGTAATIIHRSGQGELELYRQLLLECMEHSKAFTIRLAVQRQTALSHAGVPDSILQQIEELRSRIWALQGLKGEAQEEAQQHLLNEEIAVQKEWQDLQKEIAAHYPAYFQLLYQKPEVNLPTVRADLIQEKQTILAYFVLDSSLLAIIDNGAKISTHEIYPDRSWEDSVQVFNQLLGERRGMEQIAPLAAYLFQQILAPFQDDLGEQLVLFPDGMLHFLNFELLLTELPSSLADPADLPWLLRRHRIHYANHLGHAKEEASASGNKLAIAPGFSADLKADYQASLSPGQTVDSVFMQWLSTPWSLELVREFDRENWGKILLESDATKTQFLDKSRDAQLIHFATHARVEDQAPLNSFLALHPDPEEAKTGYLFAHELYGMTLSAALVVLSACQTGIGTYQEGEGVLSLAHAFQYAGSPSLIMSLWSIDDQQTNWLIRDFYDRLDKKSSISQALRQSKLAYLDQYSGELAHPYYWGSLVFVGDNQELSSAHSQKNRHVFLFVIVLIMSGLLIFWQKNKKRSQ
ncbi:MAG: CHAT domain-containing tetratricopeptide repeat protein [Bacteroidota bacterium]